MTVKELIIALLEYPQDTVVSLIDEQGRYCTVEYLDEVTRKTSCGSIIDNKVVIR